MQSARQLSQALSLADPFLAGPDESTTGSRGWEPLPGPSQAPRVFGAAGGLVPLQSFLAQGGSRTFLGLSWHRPQDKSAGGAEAGQGVHCGAFHFQPVCPEGKSGLGFHLGLDGLGLRFLISQTSVPAQVPSETGPCSPKRGPPVNECWGPGGSLRDRPGGV